MRAKHLGIYRLFWVLIAVWDAAAVVGGISQGDDARSIAVLVATRTFVLFLAYGFLALFIGWVQEERMVGWLRGVWPKPVPEELAAQLDALRGDAWRPKNSPGSQRVEAPVRAATDSW